MSSTTQPPRVYLAAHHFDLITNFTQWSLTHPLGAYTNNLSTLHDLLLTHLQASKSHLETLTSETTFSPSVQQCTAQIQSLAHTGAKVQLAYLARMYDLKLLYAEAHGISIAVVNQAFEAMEDPREIWRREIAREARRTRDQGRYLPALVRREVVLEEVLQALIVPESLGVTGVDVDRLSDILSALAV